MHEMIIYFTLAAIIVIVLMLALIWWRMGADVALIKASLDKVGFELLNHRISMNLIDHIIYSHRGRLYFVVIRNKKNGVSLQNSCVVSLVGGVLWREIIVESTR